MKESFSLSAEIPASRVEVYNSWLSSDGHSAMTGGHAECSNQVGTKHSAWDGYIWGETLELVPYKKIVQSWRTTEFAEDDEDSHLVVEFEQDGEHTLLTITHNNIPEGQTQYEQGWIDHYIQPMKAFFGSL